MILEYVAIVHMLTFSEVLSDIASAPGFEGIDQIGVATRGANGTTPLHWMALLGDVQAIRLLIEAGANIDAVDNDGCTPIHIAAQWRQTSAVHILKNSGADCTIKNAQGFAPVDVARVEGYPPTIALFDDV